MTESIKAGEILELPGEATLSDGTAGGIEPGSVTFGLCRELIDDFVVVSEEEIASAMRAVIDSHHLLIEGAAGAALAGLLRRKDDVAGRKVAVIVCGGNVSRETLKRVI